MDIRLNRKQKERLFRLLERGCNSLAYWWDCEMDGEHKDAVDECVRLQSANEELLADNARLRAINDNLRIEIIKLKKQIDPNYSPIKKNRKAMTDEEIIALAEKTKKEKYCKGYLRDSTEKPYECDLDCPFNYDGMNCEDEYETAFLDGFKAGYKKGQDSMSDYVIELQHAAYDD